MRNRPLQPANQFHSCLSLSLAKICRHLVISKLHHPTSPHLTTDSPTMPRKTKFSNESSDEEDSEVERPQREERVKEDQVGSKDPLASPPPSTLPNATTVQGSIKKRRSIEGGQLNGSSGGGKKPRLVGFTESDEEDQLQDKDSLLHLGGLAGTPNGNGKGKGKRVLLTNEEKKKMKEEAKRLLPGRKELPVWEGENYVLHVMRKTRKY